MTKLTRREAELLLAELRGEKRIIDLMVRDAKRAAADYLAGR